VNVGKTLLAPIMEFVPWASFSRIVQRYAGNADDGAAQEVVYRLAQQLPKIDRWATLLVYICQRIVGQIGLPTPPSALQAGG
jgi:hypothetical protein